MSDIQHLSVSQAPGAASATITSTPSTNAEETATDFNHSHSGRPEAELVRTGGSLAHRSLWERFSLTLPTVGPQKQFGRICWERPLFSHFTSVINDRHESQAVRVRLLSARRRHGNPSVCAANQTHFLLGTAGQLEDRSPATADGSSRKTPKT